MRPSPAASTRLVIFRAFRPYASAGLSAVVTIALVFVAVTATNSDVRLLATLAIVPFIIITVDAAIPCKVRMDEVALHYRNTFVWTSWRLEDIEELRAVDSSWLGLPVTSLSLHMKDGRVVEWPDVMVRRGDAGLPGGPVWAARVLVAASAGRLRFVG